MVKVRAGSGLGANVSSANRSQSQNRLIEDNALAHSVDDDSKGYSIASSAALFDYARLTESSDPVAPTTNLPAPVELANLGGETFAPGNPGVFSINNVTQAEGTNIGGSTYFTFTVTRSGGSSGAVSVSWFLENSSADDDDIVDLPQAGTLYFNSGETSNTITIPVSADGMYEGDDSFIIYLENPTGGASISPTGGEGWGIILNDDHGIIPPGQIAPLGGEFLVNTTTNGTQAYTSITALNDGGYVVTWTSYHSGNGDIYMQRYGADGGPLGSETRVNTNTLNDQTQPVITTLSNGSFAIAWASNHGPNSYDVQMRVYNSNGTPSTGEIRINSTDSASQQTPAITALADGGFVITWQSELQDGGGFGIYGQRFASSGAIVGGEFQINTTTTWDQQFSSIASLSNGGFVVTWTSDGVNYRDIRGQIYDSTGAKAGSEFVINPTQEDAGEFSSVTALDGGGFVVTWSAYGPDNGWDIFARVFDNSGHDIRGEFLINSVDGQQYSQQFPSVTALVGGGFLVTWSSNEQDSSDWGVYGQRIDANGEPDGAQFRISQSTIGDQYQDIPLHAVTQLLDGSVVAIWRGNGVGDDYGIFARRLGARQEYWTPEGHDSTVTINEDGVYKLYSTDFGFTDADNDNFTSIVIGTLPHPGTLTFRGMPVASGDVISVADIDMGQLVFTPIADGYGTPGDSFTFYVRDDSGTNDTDPNPHYIWFDINPVNDAPEGTDAAFAVATEQNHIFQLRDFGFSDAVEGNSFSSVRITSIPADGGLYFDTPDYPEYILPGAIINAADIAAGRFFYHAGASNGTASFTFQVQDDGGTDRGGQDTDQSANTITFEVTGTTNHAPVGTDDSYTVDEDGTLILNVLSNDSDADGNPLSIASNTNPAYGSLTLNGDGTFTYTPNANYNGSDSFTYTVTDGSATSGPVTVNITVDPVNDAPNGTDATISGQEDVPIVFTVADFGFTDVENNDFVGLGLSSLPARGTLYLNGFAITDASTTFITTADIAAGKFTFVGAHDESGVGYTTFGFQVRDNGGTANGGGDTDWMARTITINLNAVNDAPVAVNDTVSLLENATVTATTRAAGLLGNDTDVDAQAPVSMSGNLLVNGGGESGPSASNFSTVVAPQGWTTTSNFSLIDYAASGANDLHAGSGDGLRYFIGGPGNTQSTATQIVNVSGYAASIDTGTMLANLSGEFGGWRGQNDNMTMKATFLDANGNVLGTTSAIGGVTAADRGNLSQLLARDGSFEIPAGTRSISVTLTATLVNTANGTFNDGYADNVSLTLSQKTEAATLTVVGAHAGSGNDIAVAASGTTDIVGTYGTLHLAADGTYSYTANSAAAEALGNGASASDIFSYTVSDTHGATSTATVTFGITGTNDAPVLNAGATPTLGIIAGNSAAPAGAVGTLVSSLIALGNVSDADAGAQTGIAIVGADDAHGAWYYSLNGGTTWQAFGTVSNQAALLLTADSDNRIYFEPNASYTGHAEITFRAWDQTSGTEGNHVDASINGGTTAFSTAADTASITVSIPAGQFAAAGDEFRVNTFTSSFQQYPAMAALDNGGFVIVWQSYTQDGSEYGIYGQRYDASGARVGGEFRANTYTSQNQAYATVTAMADGGFLVTWSSLAQDGSDYGVYGQRYDASGAASGGEFRINTTTASAQQTSSVAALDDGSFVIVWNAYAQDGEFFGVYGQRYDATGAKTGGEFLINSTTASFQMMASVSALNGGGFIVSWASLDQDGSGWGVYAQRYNASGGRVSSEFRVNSFTSGDQLYSSAAALSDGGFVITWTSAGNHDGSNEGVYGQRYNADGSVSGGEFRINTTTLNAQRYASIIALNDGGFIVTWTSQAQDGSGSGVYGQRFDATGNKDGVEFLINQTTSGEQVQHNSPLQGVIQLADGTVVVSWSGNGVGDADGIFARLFNVQAVNHAPVGVADTYSVNEDGVLNVGVGTGVLVNDSDSDGNALSIASNTNPSHGSLTLNSNGSFTYTPNANYNGPDSFTYTASDGNGGLSAPVTVNITVNAVNDAPVGVVDSYSIGEDGVLTVGTAQGVLANDSDVDGDALTATLVTGPAHGALTLNADGSFTYTPTANYNGTDSFTYRANDGTTASDPVTVTLNVSAVNDAPTVSIVPSTGQTVSNFNQVNNTVGTFGDSSTGYYGQIFKATGTSLNSIEFQIDGTYNSSDYTVMVASVIIDGNGRFHPGAVLFESSLLTIAGDADSVFDTVLVNTGGLSLTAGASYVFLLNANAGLNNGYGGAEFKTVSNSNLYADGSFVYLHENNGSTATDFASANWYYNPGSNNNWGDLAFRLQFGATVAGFNATEQQAGTLKGAVTVADIDAGSGLLDATLSVGYGVINVAVGTSGATIVSGNGSGSVIVRGTIAQLNALLNSDATSVVTFTADTDTPPASTVFTVSVNDNGNTGSGGPLVGNATANITITAVNDAPVLDLSGFAVAGIDTTAAYTEDSAAVKLAPSLTLSDVDSSNLTGAMVTIASGFHAGDILRVNGSLSGTTASGISYNYDTNTGVLTLTGSASVADYQTVLASLAFKTNNEDPGTARDITVTVTDGVVTSTAAHIALAVTPVADAPEVDLNGAAAGINTTAAYTEGSAAVKIAQSVTISDVDSSLLTAATVSFASGFVVGDVLRVNGSLSGTSSSGISYSYDTATGVLTLSGNASVADYQALISTLAFKSNSYDPGTARDIVVTVTDGAATSTAAHIALAVTPINDAPVLDLNGFAAAGINTTAAYTEGSAAVKIAESVEISDVDNSVLTGAKITIASGFVFGDMLRINGSFSGTTASGISYSYNTGTGVLTLSGNASVADYQAAIATLAFKSDNDDPGTARDIVVTVNDGSANSDAAHIALTVTPINDAPVLDLNGFAASGIDTTAAYTEGSAVVKIAESIAISDADNTVLSGAKVTIASGFVAGDVLRVNGSLSGTTASGITYNYDAGTGVLTLSGSASVADYQATLATLAFKSDSDNPGTARDVVVTVSDGSANSDAAHIALAITPINDAPVLDLNGFAVAGINTTAAYTEGAAAVKIAESIAISDADNATLTGAKVTIASGFVTGDTLRVNGSVSGTTGSGIAYSYDDGTGVLTLTGSASVADYQAALATLAFKSNSDDPGTARDIVVTVNDGSANSDAAHIALAVTPINDAPVVDLNGAAAGINATAAYTEGSAAVKLIQSVVVSDVDNTHLTGAKVTIASGFIDGDIMRVNNSLSGTTASGIAYNYDSGTGVLTLTGSASVADYQAVLATLQFKSISDDPGTARDIVVTISDGAATSDAAHIALAVTSIANGVMGPVPVAEVIAADKGHDTGGAMDAIPAFTPHVEISLDHGPVIIEMNHLAPSKEFLG